MNNYYVYVAKADDGQVKYIGKGKGSRYTHISSGRSSCVEANSYILSGGDIFCYKIIEGLSGDKALEIEAELINILSPIWNKEIPASCGVDVSYLLSAINKLPNEGEDIEVVEGFTTQSELIEMCKYDLKDSSDTSPVEYSADCLPVLDIIGATPFQKWYKLSKLIQRRNVLCITLDEMKEVVGLKSKSMFSEWLQQMVSAGMLLVSYPEGTKNQRRVLYFNPHLVWKGSYRVRNRYRYLWNKIKGIDK